MQKASPKTDYSQMQQFRNICSLKVGKRVAVALTDVNTWSVKNQELGKYVCPVLLIVSVFGLLLSLFGKFYAPEAEGNQPHDIPLPCAEGLAPLSGGCSPVMESGEGVRQWYYTQDGHQRGPVSEAALNRMFSTGQLTMRDTYVWTDGLDDWVPARAITRRLGETREGA